MIFSWFDGFYVTHALVLLCFGFSVFVLAFWLFPWCLDLNMIFFGISRI